MLKLSRRELFAGSLFAGAGTQSPATRPNVVFIAADDLGYGDTGCYGQRRIRTPNIDRLAADGMRFTDAYSGCTLCAPSRSVLMTGQHMGHTPIRCNLGVVPLRPEERTVAEVLKSAGYATGCFGKWGLEQSGRPAFPLRRGSMSFSAISIRRTLISITPSFYTAMRSGIPCPAT